MNELRDLHARAQAAQADVNRIIAEGTAPAPPRPLRPRRTRKHSDPVVALLCETTAMLMEFAERLDARGDWRPLDIPRYAWLLTRLKPFVMQPATRRAGEDPQR